MRNELEVALHKLYNNKAPGADGIAVEMLKYDGDKLCSALHKLTNLITACHAESPTQFDLSEIIVLIKKDDKLDCGNYRSICLFSHAYNVVMTK